MGAKIQSRRLAYGALIGALVIAGLVYTLGEVVFGIDASTLPDWAASVSSAVVG